MPQMTKCAGCRKHGWSLIAFTFPPLPALLMCVCVFAIADHHVLAATCVSLSQIFSEHANREVCHHAVRHHSVCHHAVRHHPVCHHAVRHHPVCHHGHQVDMQSITRASLLCLRHPYPLTCVFAPDRGDPPHVLLAGISCSSRSTRGASLSPS